MNIQGLQFNLMAKTCTIPPAQHIGKKVEVRTELRKKICGSQDHMCLNACVREKEKKEAWTI